MFVIPLLTTLVSLAFAAQVLNQYRSRRRTHQLAWGLALVFYAVAAFPEVTGSVSGWNDPGFRLYYLFGAILLVPWLSLGTAELLLPEGRGRWGYRGFVAVVTMLGIVAVALAPLHAAHLATTQNPSNCAMWCKSEGGYVLANGLSALAAAFGNAVGTVVLVGGAGYSAFRTYRAGLPRNLTVGNLLILGGSLVVAGAATVTRLGSYEFFYAAQLGGISIIFSGFLVIASVASRRAGADPGRSQPA